MRPNASPQVVFDQIAWAKNNTPEEHEVQAADIRVLRGMLDRHARQRLKGVREGPNLQADFERITGIANRSGIMGYLAILDIIKTR